MTDLKTGLEALDNKDYKTALDILNPLAEKGDAKAQAILGLMHKNGDGVPQNSSQAMKFFKSSAEQGNPGAQRSVGVMYYEGWDDVPPNYPKAAEWQLLAAVNNVPEAQHMLGLMLAIGQGVPKNIVHAFYWVNIAALNDVKDAIKTRDGIIEKMTPEELAEAKKITQEWLIKN